ncbi:MAG: hypothetical protein J6B97_01735 [Bacteroidales bacterium]|nr:hypothetical protein [Bacteroidales bacterium]
MPINQTANVTTALVEAYGIATEKRNEFITPEHILAGFLLNQDFWGALDKCGRAEELEEKLYEYINSLDRVPEGTELSIEFSSQLKELFETAADAATNAMSEMIRTHHLIYAIFQLEDSYARFHLESCLEFSIPDFLNSLLDYSDTEGRKPQGTGNVSSRRWKTWAHLSARRMSSTRSCARSADTVSRT